MGPREASPAHRQWEKQEGSRDETRKHRGSSIPPPTPQEGKPGYNLVAPSCQEEEESFEGKIRAKAKIYLYEYNHQSRGSRSERVKKGMRALCLFIHAHTHSLTHTHLFTIRNQRLAAERKENSLNSATHAGPWKRRR